MWLFNNKLLNSILMILLFTSGIILSLDKLFFQNKINSILTSNQSLVWGAPQKPTEAEELTIGLDSYIGGTPILMAVKRNYIKDYSIHVNVKFIGSDNERLNALKAGTIDVTEMSLPSFLKNNHLIKNAGVIIGITDFSNGADGMVAKSEIKTLNDIEGKTVSFVGDGTGKFVLNKFLRLVGLRYESIKPVPRDDMSEVVNDLKSGSSDVIVSWTPDMDMAIKEINSKKAGTVKLLISTKEVPDLIPTVLVANENLLKKRPKAVEGFLKSWYISVKQILEQPDKACKDLKAAMDEYVEEYGECSAIDIKNSLKTLRLMSIDTNIEYFGINGSEDKISLILKDTIKTWYKYGDIPDEAVPSNIINSDFLKNISTQRDFDELKVNSISPELSGSKVAGSDGNNAKFVKQDDYSIEQNTEKVARADIPPIYYDVNDSKIKETSYETLNDVYEMLLQFPQYYLIIDAHTDSSGDFNYNMQLSKDRANEVKNYLVGKGIDSNRIVARGWGSTKPVVAVEVTSQDREKNRRTEFTLTRNKVNQ